MAIAGVDLAISYLGNIEGASSTVAAAKNAGRWANAFQLDQRDPQAIEACLDKVLKEYQRVDILVNNAGWNIGIPFRDLDALTAAIWDRVLETTHPAGAAWFDYGGRWGSLGVTHLPRGEKI